MLLYTTLRGKCISCACFHFFYEYTWGYMLCCDVALCLAIKGHGRPFSQAVRQLSEDKLSSPTVDLLALPLPRDGVRGLVCPQLSCAIHAGQLPVQKRMRQCSNGSLSSVHGEQTGITAPGIGPQCTCPYPEGHSGWG